MKKTPKIDKWVYAHTPKPKHYVEVRNPPKTPKEKKARHEEARQEQCNRWSKHFKVYSSSYLPKDDRKLLHQGWEERIITKNGNKVIQRKSTGQTIRSESHQEISNHHYHWLDFWKKKFTKGDYRRFKNKDFSKEKVYYNKYGELVSQINPEHHLYEED